MMTTERDTDVLISKLERYTSVVSCDATSSEDENEAEKETTQSD